MDNLCTVLVSSCDRYEDCWKPFFTLLKKYWNTRKYPIVLNTESKNFDFEDMEIKTFNMYQNNKNATWSERMLETLKKIESKYIIFMLDDFFLTDYVKEEKLQEVISWMEKDSNIGVFSFNIVEKSEFEDEQSEKYKEYALRNKKGPYRFNCQAAIWRKDILVKALRKHENPWEWELIGNKRSEKFNETFYTVINSKDMIFKYDCENIGIVRGKWRMPETKEFFDKEGINIDYEIRNKVDTKLIVKKKIITKIVNRIKFHINKIRSSI